MTQYAIENYVCNICYEMSRIAPKNYHYKVRKNQVTIYWFSNGEMHEYNFDAELYKQMLQYPANMVARMVLS